MRHEGEDNDRDDIFGIRPSEGMPILSAVMPSEVKKRVPSTYTRQAQLVHHGNGLPAEAMRVAEHTVAPRSDCKKGLHSVMEAANSIAVDALYD